MLNICDSRIVLLFCLVSFFWVALSYSWISNNIGEPKNIVAVDNHSLLVVSTDGVISKISKSSGDILWRFFHTESKEVFVEQLIPLDPVVLVFVRIDTLSYAEILNLKTGTLQWSYLTCVPGLFNNQFSEETHRGDFQYQRWQLVQDNLAILGCYNRIYLYNLYSEGYSILSYDEPQLEAFQLRLRYSPESERPDLCLIFYDKHDSLLSFGCIPFDDLHDRHGLSIMKTACESELHLLPSGQCICKKLDSLIVTTEQDTLSIERTVSLNQDFEILTTSFPSLFTIIRLKENNSIASLKVTPEEIQVEELFRSQLLKCHNWPRSKGCFMTEDLSNHRTRIQYFAVLEEFESLKLTNYSWIVDSSYFGDNIHTFIIPWNELLCYYSTVEELICLELTNVENQTKTKLLWKIDFSMTHIVTHQWLTPSSNHCTTALERSLISFYERNIQLFPRTFRLVFHQLFFGYHQEYPNINALSSSICYSQGILVTVSRCGAVQAHLLDSIGKPTLLWKSYLFDEQPRCLDRNDSIVIFSLDNELILGIWHHRVVYSTNISSNLYHDCIFYLQVDNGKLLKRHCYYSDIPFKVLSWDVRHLLMIYKNGTIQWDSYLQTPLTLKDNFQLVEIDANQLTGYEMDMQLHCTKYLYSLILSRDESICFIRTVHSRDIELKERNVHFLNGSVATKYLNPHLILIVTKRTLSKTGISVYVLDGATGNILYDSHHANASLPVSGVWIENWFLYSLRNLATSRQEIYVGEMLHSVSSSSYDDGLKYEFLETFKEATSQCDSIPQEQFPVVYLQGYEGEYCQPLSFHSMYFCDIVDIWIRDMVVTQTRNGITPQFLLLHSLDGYLFVIPKLWFHPRRPLVQDSNESSSKDVLQNMPYYPNIPLKPLHKQSEPLFLSLGVEQVVSYPDRFRESCTLIMGVGFPMFPTSLAKSLVKFGFEWVVERIAPIGQFDSLPDHFPRGSLDIVFSINEDLKPFILRKSFWVTVVHFRRMSSRHWGFHTVSRAEEKMRQAAMSNVAHHGVIEMEDGKHRISRERSIFLLVPPAQHQVIRREIRQLIPELIGEFLGMWYIMATATAITCMMLFYSPSPFLPGFLGLALPWGFAFTFMVFSVGAISGGHFNFSVTLAFACFRGFPKWKALPYFVAQVLGGTCGTLNMWFTYYPVGYQIAAGKPLSEATTVTAAFFNNADLSEYTTIHSFGIQAFYTAFLLFVIFAITDPYNPLAPGANMFPVIVGFLVMQLGCSLGMINQFTINPSRDLSARIAGAMLGMGKTALPGPGGMLWANQIGSMLGGISGGFVYEALVRPFMPRVEELGPTPFMIQWEKFYNWIRGRKGESIYRTNQNGIASASQDDQIQVSETFEQKRYIHEEDKFASNVQHVPD